MGAFASGSAHARPSAQAPIDTGGSVWEWGGEQFRKNFRSIFSPFKAILSTFRVFSTKETKKSTHQGAGGAQKISFPTFLIFVLT